MAKHPGGRPLKISLERRKELVELFEKYINETELPIIAEFAYKNDIVKTFLYDNEEFSTLIKKCTAKKETELERGSLTGKYNPSQAIFSLKQLDWRDKQEIEHSGEMLINTNDLTNLTDEELRRLSDGKTTK